MTTKTEFMTLSRHRTMAFRSLRAITVVALMSCLIYSAYAEIVTITVDEDATTYNYWTAGGYGPSVATAYSMSVQVYSFGGKSWAWFKFNLSAIPEEASISSAHFYGHLIWRHDSGNLGYEVGSYYVHDDSWREALFTGDPNGITWNSQPTSYEPIPTDSILVTTYPAWYAWDVTSAVQDAFQTDRVLSLLIKFTQDTYPDIGPGYQYASAVFPSQLRTEAYLQVEFDLAKQIPVDIKPQSCPNPINVSSKGVLPVAILGTDELDVTEIDPASIKLVGVSPLRSSYDDVGTPFDRFVGKDSCSSCSDQGLDGRLDLSLNFDTQEIVTALGKVNDGECLLLQLGGKTLDGKELTGEDVVRIIDKSKVFETSEQSLEIVASSRGSEPRLSLNMNTVPVMRQGKESFCR